MIFAVALPILSVLAVFVARMLELRTKRDTDPGPVKENLTFRIFLIVGVVMMVSCLTEYLLGSRTLCWPSFTAGWICALLSFFIRRQAIAALGRFWSLHVEIREHHQLVQIGPFRWLRHPTYFSMILELLSGALLLNAYYSMLMVPLLFIPALLLRLKLEEAALVEKFGDAYRDYQKNTPAIIPYKWPRTN